MQVLQLHPSLRSAQAILFFRRNHCMVINLTFSGCKGNISSHNSSEPSRSIEHQWTVVFSLIKLLSLYCMGLTKDKICKMYIHVKWVQCDLFGGKPDFKCKMMKEQFYSLIRSYLLFIKCTYTSLNQLLKCSKIYNYVVWSVSNYCQFQGFATITRPRQKLFAFMNIGKSKS